MIPKAQQDAIDNRASRTNISELLDTLYALLANQQVPERCLIVAVKERLWEMKL